MGRLYSDDQDWVLFKTLVASGLTGEQAVEQLQLIGIIPDRYKIGFVESVSFVSFDEIKYPKKHKNKFPHYHHKRRW